MEFGAPYAAKVQRVRAVSAGADKAEGGDLRPDIGGAIEGRTDRPLRAEVRGSLKFFAVSRATLEKNK